jgi:broad specificity phosphatase PhoE
VGTAKNTSLRRPVEIFLLRHGRTVRPGTFTGLTDIELSDTGRQQIMALQPLLAEPVFDQCYSSPLQRCRETFTLLELERGCSFDAELREINFGHWEGLRYDQVEQQYPGQIDSWSSLQRAFRFPGGDEIAQFDHRVCCWFDRMLKNTFKRVLVVSHAGVIRTAICHLLGIDLGHVFAFSIGEAGLAKIVVGEGGGRLEYLNCSR